MTRARRAIDRLRRRGASIGVASRVRASDRVPLLQVAKTSVAAVAAWVVADLVVDGQPPIFAAIAALLVVAPSVNQSLAKALERSVGVIVGVVLATGVAAVLGDAGWVILLAVVAALFVAWALRLTPGSANQIPISAMLVLSLGATSPDYALDRIVETVIGALIALVVNAAIVPPVLVGPARREVSALAVELAARLEALAAGLRAPTSPADRERMLIEARLLRPMLARAEAAVEVGRESLALNPRRSGHRDELERLEATLARLAIVVNRVAGMTRAYRDHYDEGLHAEPTVEEIAVEAERAAHDIRLLVGAPSARADQAPPDPALTAPLVVVTPDPTHWVLIGSLVEDLRRVHEEVAGE